MIVFLSLPQIFTAQQATKFIKRWTHLAKAFGIERIVFIDVHQIDPLITDTEIDAYVVDDLDAALALFQGQIPVYVEVNGEPLANFQHPEQAVYIFGSDYSTLPEATVSIDSLLSLYSDHAAAIVLHDRMKQWPLR